MLSLLNIPLVSLNQLKYVLLLILITFPNSKAFTIIPSVDVGIVGAGPAGLVLAHALQDRGYSVCIFERREAFRPVGAAIFMHPFALNSLRSVSTTLEASLLNVSTKIRSIQLGSTVDDSLKFGSTQLDLAPEVFGAPFVAIRFWDMLKALKEGLPDDIFEYDCDVMKCENAEGGVRLYYTSHDKSGSETNEICDVGMLFDAGGIRSNVRKQFVKDEPIPRLRATYAVVSSSNIEKILSPAANGDRELAFSMGDGKAMTTASLKNGDVWWTQTRYDDDPRAAIPKNPDEDLRSLLDKRFADWPDNLQGLVKATPLSDIIESTIAELPPSLKWGEGRVTLVGDSAHAQLPSLGLGVSTAFADVNELCQQIDRYGLSEKALRWYEAVRIPQTAVLQIASRLAYFANLAFGQKEKV